MNSDFQTDVFISRFAELKKESGETNKDLQDVFGLSLSALINYQTGKRIPDIAFLHKLAQHFGVSADYLLGLSDVRSTEQDIQTACEVTGLSEKAVLSLHENKEKNDMYNEMILSENFHEIAVLLHQLKYEQTAISNDSSNFDIMNIDSTSSLEDKVDFLQRALAVFDSFVTAHTIEKIAGEWIDKLIGKAMYTNSKWSDVEKIFSLQRIIIAQSSNKSETIDFLQKLYKEQATQTKEANNHAKMEQETTE